MDSAVCPAAASGLNGSAGGVTQRTGGQQRRDVAEGARELVGGHERAECQEHDPGEVGDGEDRLGSESAGEEEGERVTADPEGSDADPEGFAEGGSADDTGDAEPEDGTDPTIRGRAVPAGYPVTRGAGEGDRT